MESESYDEANVEVDPIDPWNELELGIIALFKESGLENPEALKRFDSWREAYRTRFETLFKETKDYVRANIELDRRSARLCLAAGLRAQAGNYFDGAWEAAHNDEDPEINSLEQGIAEEMLKYGFLTEPCA